MIFYKDSIDPEGQSLLLEPPYFMAHFVSQSIQSFLKFQRRFAWLILLLGLILSVMAFPRAVKLLTTIKTSLINLLPDHYPSVHYTEEIQKKFNRRSSMFVILNSPHKEANQKAMLAAKDFLLKEMPEIDFIEIKKAGYEFLDQNKLLLVDLKDIYTLHDRLKDKIQKRKLGGLYIDFEDDENEGEDDVKFDDLIKKYKDEFTEGVQSPYKSNEDGSVYVLNVYPKSTDSSLKYFKKFGQAVQNKANSFDYAQFHPDIKVGYAGAIITRVDQYDALINDLKTAGIISAISIFLLLYFYFGRMIAAGPGVLGFLLSIVMRALPVILIFIPMIMSTLLAFCFCSYFFSQLNVVTSFLFAIIFGLGVDIGIHLITRFIQDRGSGLPIEEIQKNVLIKTGKSCAIGILTTVASFYILTINDFKGFSEFGWIAGNGLLIALASYLLFFPCLLILVDRYGILKFKKVSFDLEARDEKRRWIPGAKWILMSMIGLTALAAIGSNNIQFEWNFNKLKMKIPHREHQKALLKQIYGRSNSPAVYLIENKVQARKIRQIIRERKENDQDIPTIQFLRSYYDMVPYDQEEKLAVLSDIQKMLEDDALNTVKGDEKKLMDDLKKAISKTKKIQPEDVPQKIHEVFWGNTGETDSSVAYIMPLPHLELDNGNYARAFYEDVYDVQALGKQFYALSDSIIFAEVLQTLFRDSKRAVLLALVVIFLLISLHFRDVKRTLFVVLGVGCGIVWMLGLMSLLDFRLNFYNMIIIPAMMGMGVDNSVHIVHRFDEVGRRSIMTVLKTSGGAAFMASLTTMLGYSGMLFTLHPGLQSIGMMAVLGMGTCLVSSLVVLPLLLQVFLRENVS